MQITINNPSLEAQLIAKAQKLHIKVDDLIEKFLNNCVQEDEALHYIKKDPFKSIKKLEYDEKVENPTNPFKDIDDVVVYSKELRKSAWR
jgi:hypothetical protein